MRWLSLLAGVALIAVAFVAATRVENSRQGLIAEVILYLGGAAGLVLLFYGLFARSRRSTSVQSPPLEARAREPKVPSANDLVLGTAGIVLAVVLLSGLAISAAWTWVAFGLVLLLPMVAGSFYLTLRFLRAPTRDWRVDLRPFRGAASKKKHSDHDQSDRPDHVPVNKSQVVGEKEDAKDNQDQTEGN
jgi:uncharacterized membrane protein HdeD (DUF308 family)